MCINRITIFASDNGLSPGRHQAIIWTNAVILLIWPLGTNFCEILIEIQTFSFKKMHLKMSSAKRQSFCSREDENQYNNEHQDDTAYLEMPLTRFQHQQTNVTPRTPTSTRYWCTPTYRSIHPQRYLLLCVVIYLHIYIDVISMVFLVIRHNTGLRHIPQVLHLGISHDELCTYGRYSYVLMGGTIITYLHCSKSHASSPVYTARLWTEVHIFIVCIAVLA